MLTKIKLYLCAPEGAQPNVHWGSLLHGALMRAMPLSASDLLHGGGGMRPYSQYIEPLAGSSAIWQIGLFGRGAEAVGDVLPELKEVFLKGRGIVRIEDIAIEQVTKRDFIEKTVEEAKASEARYALHLIVPCAQKSKGVYLPTPSIRLLLENLYARVQCHLPDTKAILPDALEQIVNCTQAEKSMLRSAPYYMERVKIPGFTGAMQLSLDAERAQRIMFSLMIQIAEYTGMGIKTALGMGGVRVAGLRSGTCKDPYGMMSAGASFGTGMDMTLAQFVQASNSGSPCQPRTIVGE